MGKKGRYVKVCFFYTGTAKNTGTRKTKVIATETNHGGHGGEKLSALGVLSGKNYTLHTTSTN